MDDDFFIHEHALVETEAIGPRTRIWAFAHVMPGAVIGADCNVCDHTFIESGTVIGDRVTIKSGVYLWDGLRVQDDVFIGPQATFTNDHFPRSKQPFEPVITTICQGATIGAGASERWWEQARWSSPTCRATPWSSVTRRASSGASRTTDMARGRRPLERTPPRSGSLDERGPHHAVSMRDESGHHPAES